ncbi:MAG TPA: nitroreductase family protein, partial [Massilibacterium sp.]|nr:nitroreductase family protein [Massilibacterium sp.]
MNETIQTLTNHRSIRKYKDQPLTEEQLAVILESIRRAPTSINGQQVSVIVVQNKERKKKLAA